MFSVRPQSLKVHFLDFEESLPRLPLIPLSHNSNTPNNAVKIWLQNQQFLIPLDNLPKQRGFIIEDKLLFAGYHCESEHHWWQMLVNLALSTQMQVHYTRNLVKIKLKESEDYCCLWYRSQEQVVELWYLVFDPEMIKLITNINQQLERIQ